MTFPRIGYDARFINDQYHGIGRYAYHLLEGASRLDTATQFVVLYNPALPNTRFNLDKLFARHNVEPIPTDLGLYSIAAQFKLAELAYREQLDLWVSPYILVPMLMPCPVQMTIPDFIYEHYPQYQPSQSGMWLYRMMVRLGTWRARKVVTISHSSADSLRKFYPINQEKIGVVHLAIDHQTYNTQISSAEIEAVRAKYNLPQQFMLTVGTQRPHKNIDAVVDAFAKIAIFTKTDLVLAGPVDNRFPNECQRKVKQYQLEDRVHFTGFVDEADMPALYAAASLFVYPSRIEGFGLPILEAMACGTAVITSNVSSMPEVAGDAAKLVQPTNIDAIADAMLTLLNNDHARQQLEQNGAHRARQFRWDASARSANAIWHHALRRRQGKAAAFS